MVLEDLEMPEMNSPQRGSKEGYLQLFFISRQQLGRIIETSTSITDKRIIMYTRFMISSITDDGLRAQAEDELDLLLKEIADKDISNEERAEQTFVVCMRLQGDIVAFYDQFLGITHRLRIGTV